MTNGQKMVVNYLQSRGITEYSLSGLKDVVSANRVYKVNLYGDILDAKTKEIIADADISHNILTIGTKIPTKWTDRNK